jgi:hypothetical protein
MLKQAPPSATSLALAGAQPYTSSGTLISIYEDRVQRLLATLPSVSQVLLAYVLAHELGHVLMGSDYHADAGIMKAQWSAADYAAMRGRALRFTESDSDRIRGLVQIVPAFR